MLNNSTIFSSFSTDKLFETHAFYTEILSLETELIEDRFIHVFPSSGEPVVIYYKPNHSPADFTVLNFQIKDIALIVKGLTEKGVDFLQYDDPIRTDASGISWDDEGSHLAWFKDPGGNILALIEN